MSLASSRHLKELPNLSNATNMERLNLNNCTSLVEIPSFFSHLHKLLDLWMAGCINLEVIPANMNLASLKKLALGGCSRLRKIQVISPHIEVLDISKTSVEDVPQAIRICSRLKYLGISNCENLKGLTHLPMSVTVLNLSYSDIERFPDCITTHHGLRELYISGCRKLTSIPKLPGSLKTLTADDCESLETVFCPLNISDLKLNFLNCFKLDQQARKAIIQPSVSRFSGMALLPGKEVPAEFYNNRTRGNSLTISLEGIRENSYIEIEFCVVISPKQEFNESFDVYLFCRHIGIGDLNNVDHMVFLYDLSNCKTEHLCIFSIYYHTNATREIAFEFSVEECEFDIIEYGAEMWTEEIMEESYGRKLWIIPSD